ncbi:MAG: mitochondrial fission ELM1 family protein [Gammaproteobacteria bacterium]|nr:mitochondrial fission ELM1 family protein [Gammaproteobacteria bacterium]
MVIQHKPKTFIIWRISDGRPGHDTQSRGLVNALKQLASCICHDIEARNLTSGVLQYILRRYPPGMHLPDPDLIIGAGHRTHLSMLCAQHARGGQTVVIMKPSFPVGWFDCCLIPDHDNPPDDKSIFVTRGAINMVAFSRQHHDNEGLILIGGPSRHYRWDNDAILNQINIILEHFSQVSWKITDSPRTPDITRNSLTGLNCQNALFFSHKTTVPGWVAARLAHAGKVWVSEDSISMIYESLTSGASTGILRVPIEKHGKIFYAIQTLKDKDMITTFDAWRNGDPLAPPVEVLDEAKRVANYLLLERKII